MTEERDADFHIAQASSLAQGSDRGDIDREETVMFAAMSQAHALTAQAMLMRRHNEIQEELLT